MMTKRHAASEAQGGERRNWVLGLSNLRGRRGFSLPEVVMSLAIIAGSLGTFVMLSMGSLRQLRMAADYYSASLIGRNQIERMRTMDFDAAATSEEIKHVVDDYGNTTPYGNFTRQTKVTVVNPDLIQIEVTIFFPSPRGNFSSQPYEMSTMLARGLHQ